MLSLAVAVTVTVPETVALFAGVVICVVGGVMSVPVPVRLLLCVPALSVTVTVAVRAPYPVGVNVTVIVQLELPASVVPQLFVCPKSPAFTPVTATEIPVTAVVPPFVNVNGCGPLEVPTP
jgi:hypothetical protein